MIISDCYDDTSEEGLGGVDLLLMSAIIINFCIDIGIYSINIFKHCSITLMTQLVIAVLKTTLPQNDMDTNERLPRK